MKTFLSLMFALVPFVSFAQPILRNPMTTNRFMIGVPSNGQVPAWNTAAGRWSNTTVSASGGDTIWTNDNGLLYTMEYPSELAVSNRFVKSASDRVHFSNTAGNNPWLVFTNSVGTPQLPIGAMIGGLASTLAFYVDASGNASDYNGTGWYVNNSGSAGFGGLAFEIDGAGDLTKVRNVTYSWPASQGAANTVLTEDGAGNLAWATGGLWTTVANGFVMLRDGMTNSLRVSTNGLFGIAIGDTNALNSSGWPAIGNTYMSFLDGSAGHTANHFFHGVINQSDDITAYANLSAYSAPSESVLNLDVTNNTESEDAGVALRNRGYDAYLRMTDIVDDSVISIEVGGTNQSMIYAKWQGQDRFLVQTNGSLRFGATTNHITFGATNAPPASTVAPTRWVSVLINGEATQYKIPLYQ